MPSICISSGHGLYVRGAAGILDEVDEARRVVEALVDELRNHDVEVVVFHDDHSTSQSQNLDAIVNAHNKADCDLNISIHFNAFEQREEPVGTEVLYKTQEALAARMSAAIAAVGFINRGAKYNDGLKFLNATNGPAVLVEVCFVDSEADADIYREQFDQIIENLVELMEGDEDITLPPPSTALFTATGPCSYFGGPEDTGVSTSEGLAFIYDITEDNQFLFLPLDSGTGLARRLNPAVHYLACRWDYAVTSKQMLAGPDIALVRNTKTGLALKAFPADWGPHESTGRVADLSPSLMEDLDLTTDDEVSVIYPYRG